MARFALSLAMALWLGAPLAAQDALPETPRELRDFRLDPENASPEPQVTPPPVVPTLPQEQAPTPSREQPAPPRAQPDEARPEPGPLQQAAAPAPETDDVVTQPEQALPLPAEPLQEPVPAAAAPSEAPPLPWLHIIAAMVVAALALFAFLALRRRKSVRDEEPDLEADIKADQVKEAPRVLEPAIPAIKLAAPPLPPAKRAEVRLEFIPDKATLSFASLTVKGQLRIVNEGDIFAYNLRLRATLLSANSQQEQIISAFHDGQIKVAQEPIGDAKPGETLALQIEIAVPLAELQSFEVDKKRIMVPLFIADLAYELAGEPAMAKIACLVGKESQPPASKMAPFRLDLGPRSFAPLGQRPLYA